jgi:hypothetical protein
MAQVKKLSNEAILDRLLKSIDKKFLPDTMKPQSMIEGIALCMEYFEDARKYNTKKYENAQRKQLQLVRDRLIRIQRLMQDDDLFGAAEASPRALIHSAIKRLDYKIAEPNMDPQDGYYRQTFKGASPFERLFGDWLPALYKEAGFLGGRSIAELASARGPYVKFAKCFADIHGIRKAGRAYATASFVKAVKRFFSPPKTRIRFKYLDEGDAEFFEWAEQDRREQIQLVYTGNAGAEISTRSSTLDNGLKKESPSGQK